MERCNGSGGFHGKPDGVQANAIMPPLLAGERSQPRERERRIPGRRISRVKPDQLRAAGKCFQCEETGRDQRNCPKLHSIRRPAMGVGSIVFIGMAGMATGQDGMEGTSNDPEATESERRAYELCAMEWDDDARWWNIETRATSRHGLNPPV